MNNYSYFRYITGDSKIHKMNSKMKIIWILLTTLLILLSMDFLTTSIIFLIVLFVMYKSKIKLSSYLRSFLIIWPIYVLSFLIFILLSKSLILTMLLTTKIILFVLLFIILTLTTSLSEIAWGLECLLKKLNKLKVPVSKISLGIALRIKFISTIFEQSKEIRKSMAYRGVSYNKNKLSSTIKMILPILRLSYKLSKSTISAMKLRFYGSSKKRTNYHENKTTNFDKWLIAIDVILIYVVLFIGWF